MAPKKKSVVSGAKKPRADAQLSGLAGELFVAAELLKRGFQTSITFGNAKAIDLLVHNPKIEHTFTVQVKALRAPNYFLIAHGAVRSKDIFVFVLLNKPGVPVRYFVVPGAILANEPERFGRYFVDLKMPGIHSKILENMPEFVDGWHCFENAALANPDTSPIAQQNQVNRTDPL